ncbi:AraC family transcriptional regulator [Ramlibacter sp.]|uniref:helix-turn-helix domain-containing protein n=1 Tax=Ramlibacter sp. TaxID=1917967 RepID=UPI001834FE60|nr:AraC family transcriptional regulator [Ramlibacter sp.]MBA2675049.1 helix-turn-helix transcriptional regulator [Ramlibacter sp.]
MPLLDIQLARQRNPPGGLRLPPIAQHRLALHLSGSTPTICRATQRPFTRVRGDIDWIPATTEGGFGASVASATLEIRIPAALVDQVAQASGLPASPCDAPRHLLRDRQLAHLALALEAGGAGDGLFARGVATALAQRVLQLLAPGRAGTAAQGDLQPVLQYIALHLDGNLALDQLGRVAGMSRAQLQRRFKAAQGMPVHRYVVMRRTERARELLAQGELAPAQAALAAGFAHQSHMARWLKRLA